ncbi:MAG: hypothetical protein H0V00_10115 [Chloroflexia bacterium]|nr:hypothetical protein [Chloroflexia bacterium]
MTDEKTAAGEDYNELRVHEVLVDPASDAVVALRIEAVWASRPAATAGEPSIWDRTIFVVAAVGPLASAEVGDRLELRLVAADN